MRLTKPAIVFMILAIPLGILFGVYAGSRMPGFVFVFLIAIVGLLIWILASNKQGARLNGADLDEARALRPPGGKTRVFIVRKGFVGSQQGMNFTVDGYEGQMRTGFLLTADVEPGTHVISAKMNKGTEKTRINHELTLAPGAIVLVEVGIQSGIVQGSAYFEEITDRDEIRRLVAGAKPIAWLRTPADAIYAEG